MLDGRTAEREEVGLLMATGRREPEADRGSVMTSVDGATPARAGPVMPSRVQPAQPAQPFWRRGRIGKIFAVAAVPVASVLLALIVAAVIILISSSSRPGPSTGAFPSSPTARSSRAPSGRSRRS